MLENALLLEAQMMKIGSAFDGFSMDFFSNERLRHYHELFVKQADSEDFVAPAVANSQLKLTGMVVLWIEETC